jgi:hypothetical protein
MARRDSDLLRNWENRDKPMLRGVLRVVNVSIGGLGIVMMQERFWLMKWGDEKWRDRIEIKI